MAILIYFIGVFLHVKIIKLSLKEKNSITWKVDIMNSAMLLSYFFFKVMFTGINYVVQDLYEYTGKWFCYGSEIATFYGIVHLTSYTFIISLLKYVMIVKNEKVSNIGKEKMMTIFLWINFFFPIYSLLVYVIVRPDFFTVYDGISHANLCLGKSELQKSKLHNLCDIPIVSTTDLDYFVAFVRKTICWCHTIVMYAISFNFVEIFSYFFIFRSMRR